MKKTLYLCTRSETINLGITWWKAPVAELVDASDLGSGVLRRAGSSPVRRTKQRQKAHFSCKTHLKMGKKAENRSFL